MLHPLFDFLSFLLTPPYILLPCGFLFLCMGVEATFSGKIRTRFGSVIYRAKEPKEFWWSVAASYLGWVFLIACLLYKVYWH